MRFYALFVNHLPGMNWAQRVYFGLAAGAGKMAPFHQPKK